MHERGKKNVKILDWKLKKKSCFGRLGLKVKIIIKWMLKKLGLII
jgi:hypothetical protein